LSSKGHLHLFPPAARNKPPGRTKVSDCELLPLGRTKVSDCKLLPSDVDLQNIVSEQVQQQSEKMDD